MSKRIFSVPDNEETILNKCPICGAELEYIVLNQYSDVYRILKSGKISKRKKFRRDEGSMECGFINCTKCEFHTDCDLDTNITGDYECIHIHENNKGQFMIEVER